MIARLKNGRKENSRGSSTWSQYSRQQRCNKRRNLASGIQGALSFCEEDGFKPCSFEVENVDTGEHEVIDIAAYSQMDVSTSSTKDDT